MKSFMLFLTASLALATIAEARSSRWLEECTVVGQRKVAEQAKAWDLEFDPSAIHVCGTDDRWYNPYKYAWFCVTGKDRDGKVVHVSKLTQKPGRGDCF